MKTSNDHASQTCIMNPYKKAEVTSNMYRLVVTQPIVLFASGPVPCHVKKLFRI